MNILLVHLREGGREGKEGERERGREGERERGGGGERAGGKDEGRQRERGREGERREMGYKFLTNQQKILDQSQTNIHFHSPSRRH